MLPANRWRKRQHISTGFVMTLMTIVCILTRKLRVRHFLW